MVTDSRPIRPRFDDETTVDPAKIDTVLDEMTTQIPSKPSDVDIDTNTDIDIDGEALMTTIMDFIKDVSTESSIPRVDDTDIDEGKVNV
jgi:hypothetical protein